MHATPPATNSRVDATEAAQALMKAITHRRYGAPDVLTLEDVARPVPGPDDVLVRVMAAGASIGDHHIVTGKPYLIRATPFGGLPRPRNLVPGSAMAGQVAAVGKNVTTFGVGDDVYGETTRGAFAEYVVVAASVIGRMPTGLTFDEAAAVPWAVTALQALRDTAGLKAGQKVLINGAAGAVGTWAVQLAKAMGAEVTAVCSTRNLERMRELGASHVIDYTKEDFVTGGARFDVLLDLVGNRSLSEFRSVLTPTGAYVACGGDGSDWVGPFGRLIVVLITSLFSKQKLKAFVANPNAKDLAVLTGYVERGEIRPILHGRFPLAETAKALSLVGEGRSQGSTVVTVAG
ncbi:MAG: NAD(P)-dependent alcohol dehydrogenase [Myxococcales bacterium]|nr:NAD(P)-dependent alcohol dehydrogenase [Myxococcales bacterium]